MIEFPRIICYIPLLKTAKGLEIQALVRSLLSASIAQLVERRSRKAQASGSIPLAGSSKFKDLWIFCCKSFFVVGQ